MDEVNSTITVFEDIQEVCELNSRQKEGILELKKILGSQNVILQIDNNLMIRKYVGFFANKDIKLQILPKIFSEEKHKDNEQIKTSVNLLLRLLSYTQYVNLKDLPPTLIEANKCNIFELFITLLTTNFITQYKRSINKDYILYEENLTLIKGKILFGKSIVKNSFLNHKHYCEYDEFTENNLLNRIFKSTFNNLILITESSENKKLLINAITFLENVDKTDLSKEIFNKVKFTRLNENYRSIFNLAKMFYNNSQPGLQEGDEFTFSFLIPLNHLFEFFTYKLVRRCLAEEECKVYYQRPTKHLAHYNNEKVLPQRPDIVVKRNKKIVLILDAKYHGLYNKQKFAPSISDIYQLITYSVNYECENINIISPYYIGGLKLEHSKNTYIINNHGRKILLKFIQLDITQDFEKLASELQEILNVHELLNHPDEFKTAVL